MVEFGLSEILGYGSGSPSEPGYLVGTPRTPSGIFGLPDPAIWGQGRFDMFGSLGSSHTLGMNSYGSSNRVDRIVDSTPFMRSSRSAQWIMNGANPNSYLDIAHHGEAAANTAIQEAIYEMDTAKSKEDYVSAMAKARNAHEYLARAPERRFTANLKNQLIVDWANELNKLGLEKSA